MFLGIYKDADKTFGDTTNYRISIIGIFWAVLIKFGAVDH